MGQLYGSWLNNEFDLDSFCTKLRESQSKYFLLYERRVNAIAAVAEYVVVNITKQFPNLNGKIHISYGSIISAIGRYVNDIMHYKVWHDVKLANKAKMIAHTIKWLAQYNVIVSSVSGKDYFQLSKKEKRTVLQLNTIFIGAVIRYFLSHFCDGHIPSAKNYSKIFYLIDTGQFDAKNAAVAFEGLIL